MAEFNLVQAVFDRSLLAPSEDVAVMTMHIRKHIALAPDVGPITDTERNDFTAKFNTFWGILQQYITTKIKLRELRYYDVPSVAGADMGPPKKVATINSAGTSAGQPLPPQVALSVTFKTDVRKHWGRFYIPGFTSIGLTAAGRPALAACQTIAPAAAALCSRSGTGANLTVWSPTHRVDYDVSQVQVDDTYDVIRRRRFSNPENRAIGTP